MPPLTPPGDSPVAQEAETGALDFDEWADHPVGGDGVDGGKSGGARAAEKAEDDGFGLVGAGVGEGDAGRESAGEVIAEKG